LSVVLAASLFLSVALAAVAQGSSPGRAAPENSGTHDGRQPMAFPGSYFDYFVIILMENHNFCDLYAHEPPCTPAGSANYLTALADQYAVSLNYNYGGVNPSLPNYLAISGGSDFGCAGYDGAPHSNPCTNTTWAAQDFVDLFEGASPSLTWKAYMEDMPTNPGNCTNGDRNSGNYSVRHNPFQYYGDIRGTPARCARVVPAGPTAGSDATFLNDLNSTGTASNFIWLTPNNCHNMHSCSIGAGDAYLQNLVPRILNSTVFATQRAVLAVIFDEGYGNSTWASFAGPAAKNGYTSTTDYDHYSLLKTIETNWGLPSLTSNDENANAMTEFLQSGPPPLAVDFTSTPASPTIGQNVTFMATSSGGTPPVTFAWTFGDGGTASGNPVTHAYGEVGTFPVQLTATDSDMQVATHSTSIIVSGSVPILPRFCPAGFGITDRSVLEPHSSIQIDSNSQFDAGHGVRSGGGTQADPYLISDWYLDGSLEPSTYSMLRIAKTNVYVTVKNVFISKMDSPSQWVGLEVGESSAEGATKFVTIQNVNVEVTHASGIGIWGGSDTITVRDSCVNMEAAIDWTYGMFTARNTTTVTFAHNYINAHTAGTTFHTTGIHVSDAWVSDAQSATGIVVDGNLIVNATSAGILLESSRATEAKFNTIYENYPGRKAVGPNYPVGIQVQQKSLNATVHDNEIYNVRWGILVGADYGRYHNNKVHNCDWGVYLANNGEWTGISSNVTVADNTVAWSIANSVYRLPTDANHDNLWLVDLPNTGVTQTDFSKVLLRWPAANPPTKVEYEVRSGNFFKVRIAFPAPIGWIFDVGGTTGTEVVKVTHAVPSGQSISTFAINALSIDRTAWRIANSASALFTGTGFTPSTSYALKKDGLVIQCLISTGSGVLTMGIPASVVANYELVKGTC